MGDVTGVDVDGLHGTGRRISGRSTGAGASAKNLRDGLDGASVGHSIVKTALSSYVTGHVLDASNKLPTLLEAGGTNVSNVAATANNSDQEGARNTQGAIDTTVAAGRINRAV